MAPPRLILAIRLGPRRGKQAILRPGEVVSVGRSDVADMVVPEDQQLSPKHFEIRWDGAEARVKDLGSAGGTRVNGEPCREATVRHGGWIRAGQLDFSVHVEAHT